MPNRTWSWLVIGGVIAAGACTRLAATDPAGTLVPSGLRRLSVDEYDNTLRDLVLDTTRPAGRFLPEDVRTPFDNDQTTQVASPALVDGNEALARDVAARLLADPARRDAVVGCVPTGPQDAACMESFVRRFGRRALRRPLTEAEVDAFVALSSFAAETADFYTGVETALWAFLQHPEFLYRVEVGTPIDGEPGVHRLGSWELVARVSYVLWGTMPDDRLLDAAAAAEARGEPLDGDDLRDLAGPMLADPRAVDRIDRFHAMWLGFDQLGGAGDTDLARDMRTETRRLIERIVLEQRRPWADLFVATESFLTPALAEHYGLPVPASPDGDWVGYGDSGRGGILSHGSFLSVGTRFDDTSPVQRGLAVRTRLLCEEIPPPPPNVNVDDAPAGDGPCKWDRYEALLAPGCVGCHGEINPAGWGLEEWDGLGRPRQVDDAGCDLAPHATGELVGLGTFRGPRELGAVVADSDALRRCLGEQLFRFALGRSPGDHRDATFAIDLIARDSLRLDEVLLDLVSSPAFLHRVEVSP